MPQILDLNLLCSQEEHEPTFKSYNQSTAVIEWTSSSACALGEDDSNNPPNPPTETTGNGLGWFFLLSANWILGGVTWSSYPPLQVLPLVGSVLRNWNILQLLDVRCKWMGPHSVRNNIQRDTVIILTRSE